MIPFLGGFLGTKYMVTDFVDCLNYWTSYLLGFFAVVLAGKQYFGTPILCWDPNELNRDWIRYAEGHCFAANSFRLPSDQLPEEGPVTGGHHNYYRWVPILLALQSFCFFLPNYFWSWKHWQMAINPEKFTKAANRVEKLFGAQQREETYTLAVHIMLTLKKFERGSFFEGRRAALLYLLAKALFALNIYLQYLIMTAFLGQNCIHWGYNMASNLYHGIEEDSAVFPRSIICDFNIGTAVDTTPYRIQCDLTMNYFHEMLYFVLCFWFIFLGFVNVLSCLYQLAMVAVPQLWSRGIRRSMTGTQRGMDVSLFVKNVLQPDGLLLLRFISIDVGSLFSSELAEAMFHFISKPKKGFYSRTSSRDSVCDVESGQLVEYPNV